MQSTHLFVANPLLPPLSQASVLVNGARDDVINGSNSALAVGDWGSWVCLLLAYSLAATFFLLWVCTRGQGEECWPRSEHLAHACA